MLHSINWRVNIPAIKCAALIAFTALPTSNKNLEVILKQLYAACSIVPNAPLQPLVILHMVIKDLINYLSSIYYGFGIIQLLHNAITV